MRNTNKKVEQTVLNTKIQRRYPKDEVRGDQIQKLQGKERKQLRRKRKEFR